MFVDSLYINKELLAKTPVLRCTKKLRHKPQSNTSRHRLQLSITSLWL